MHGLFSIIGARAQAAPPKSTPMHIYQLDAV